MDDSKREEARALIDQAREVADYWKYHRKLDTANLIERMADVLDILLTPPADPTDDEREALVNLLVNNRDVIAGSMAAYVDSEATADLVLAARRPTPATRERVAEFIEDNTGVDWLHGSPDGLTDALMSRFTITPKVDPDAENY